MLSQENIQIVYDEINDIDKLIENANYKKYLNIILNDNYDAIVRDNSVVGYELEHSDSRYLKIVYRRDVLEQRDYKFIYKTINDVNMSVNIDKQKNDECYSKTQYEYDIINDNTC